MNLKAQQHAVGWITCPGDGSTPDLLARIPLNRQTPTTTKKCIKLPNGMSSVGPRKPTRKVADQPAHESGSESRYGLLLAARGPTLQMEIK